MARQLIDRWKIQSSVTLVACAWMASLIVLDVGSPVSIDGIRMASLEDIGAMKFNAITREPSRVKDFVDIYFLLEKKNLNELTNAFLEKYPNVSAEMAHRSLPYHDELDKKSPIHLLKAHSFSFEDMSNRLQMAVINPHRKFMPNIDRPRLNAQLKQNESQAPTERKRGKGKRL